MRNRVAPMINTARLGWLEDPNAESSDAKPEVDHAALWMVFQITN
jgi:hypothetical protein